MSPPTIPEQQRTLGALLRLPYEALQGRVYGGLAAAGFPDIRAAHSSVFRHIRPEGSRVTDLAERAQMTKQSMAYLVDSLAASGYAELLPDPLDGRAKRVRLTARGEAVLATLLRLSAEAEADIASLLGSTRASQLRGLLEAWVDALEARREVG
jgi:DNA-binding MarR family transcriptional regulator